MFHGVTHIDLPVTDLERAEKFWRDLVGLQETARGDGYVDLDSGSVTIRLARVRRTAHRVTLRIQSPDIEAAHKTLLANGAISVMAPERTAEQQLMAVVADADGHQIILWRALTEDEYDFVPDLPKEGQWQSDAEHLLKNLLSHVPALFRSLARRKVTPYVELLALKEKAAVNREHVIRGYILCTAKPMRDRLRDALRSEGISPEDYQAEFDDEGVDEDN